MLRHKPRGVEGLGMDSLAGRNYTERIVSMREFIISNGIWMTTSGSERVINQTKYAEYRLNCEDRNTAILWVDGTPDLPAVLSYMALVALSIEDTDSPSEWLEEYGAKLCNPDELEKAEDTYRECVTDMLRLRLLLGCDAFHDLIRRVELGNLTSVEAAVQ